MTPTKKPQPSPAPAPLESGRGALILVLGILSLVMFGFLTGIPAWVMGHTDLKRMREGLMESTDEGLTRAGMILGIIGTVITGLIVLLVIVLIFGIASAVGIAVFETQSVENQKEAIESELMTLAEDAYTYRMESGSYNGYQIADEKRRTAHATYTAIISADQIEFTARARKRRGSIVTTLNAEGNLVEWSYRGAFSWDNFDLGVHSNFHEPVSFRVAR